MKAEPAQQRSLLELAQLDAELARLAHRAAHLPERKDVDRIQAERAAAAEQLASLGIALADLETEITRLESEIEAVRQREQRDRNLLDSGATNAKQVADLNHELQTLQRRRATLEDSLLEVMEQREELTTTQSAETTTIDRLQAELDAAQQALDSASAELQQQRARGSQRRDELTGTLDAELLALYERQRAAGGAGAGPLQGSRCGACRIEIDRGELARIAAAAADEVLRCPECGAILLRTKDFDR